MLGLFGTLNLAARSLQTQMTGVEVAGQNLANVNTAGYSRQRVIIESGPSVNSGVGPQGTGANVVAIERIVSSLLDGQIQNQASVSGYWNSQQDSLTTVQSALNEFLDSTGSSGLSAQLNSFFNAAQAVATSPTSISARQALIAQAQTLASSFDQINTRLDGLSTALDASLTNQVDSANQLLASIASLNDEIANAENFSGGVANELRDTRQQKLEELSKLISFQSSTAADGSVSISVSGNQLVSGNQVVNSLQAADPGNTGQVLVYTNPGNAVLPALSGGSIQATIDARDGTLADLRSSINALASNLITEVNALHATGFDLAGGNGEAFFTGTDASDIGVNQTLVDDPSRIQASNSATAGGDGSVALALAQLATTAQAGLSNETFSGWYGQAVAKLGNALSNANDQVANQTAVTNMLANQRNSISGVSIDEEMTSLLTYQRAYQASAQLVSTVDEMLQTLLAMKS